MSDGEVLCCRGEVTASGPAPQQRRMCLAASQLAHYCDNRAMQYYRLWIYTCNGLLLVCVLGFAIVAVHTVIADERRNLVPGLSLLQPTFVYGYLAVLTQSGLIQLIGEFLNRITRNFSDLQVFTSTLLASSSDPGATGNFTE